MIDLQSVTKESGVYSLTNTKDGKRYIGFSSDIQRRVNEHIYRMENNYKGYLNPKLLNAWKLDKSYFILEVLELTLDTSREEYWTRHYRSHMFGYNFSIGLKIGYQAKFLLSGHSKTLGFTGRLHTKESIQKMIDTRTGLKRNSITKQLMSHSASKVWETRDKSIASNRIRGENNPGSKLNESQVRAIKYLSNKGYSRSKLSEMYLISSETISRIVRGKIWKHVTL